MKDKKILRTSSFSDFGNHSDGETEIGRQMEIEITTRGVADKIVELYHELCPSQQRVRRLTHQRRRNISNRFKQYGRKIETFDVLFRKVEASDFLSARTGKRTKPFGLDWIIKPENMIKILEGYYENEDRI